MLFPLIGARLHGWLDDAVALLYFVGAWALSLRGAALAVALAGGGVHFALARVTDYPQGTVKWMRFRTHAFVELAEGVLVLLGAAVVTAGVPERAFLAAMGFSQFIAFSFSDYRWPLPAASKVQVPVPRPPPVG